jgi:hypothetical protein
MPQNGEDCPFKQFIAGQLLQISYSPEQGANGRSSAKRPVVTPENAEVGVVGLVLLPAGPAHLPRPHQEDQPAGRLQ